MAPRKRVVIVDDSAALRGALARVLSADARLEVVGAAADPFEARRVIRETGPDVVTLDVEMPRMNGLSFLEKIVTLRPLPVVMLSSLTGAGSDLAVEALSLGAVDAVGKEALARPERAAELCERVYSAALARVEPRASRPVPPHHSGFRWNGQVVLIGASTGGVDALERVLGAMPSNCPPIAVVQHMPASFLESLAHRLSGLVAPRVVLAREGMAMAPGVVVFAPGGAAHLELAALPGGGRRAMPLCRIVEGPRVSGHRPSVDRLFHSAVGLAPRIVAALLTGMGGDGAAGMLALREAGAGTLVQSRESCTVWGMPRVAWEMGAAEAEVPLDRIAQRLLARCAATGKDVTG